MAKTIFVTCCSDCPCCHSDYRGGNDVDVCSLTSKDLSHETDERTADDCPLAKYPVILVKAT